MPTNDQPRTALDIARQPNAPRQNAATLSQTRQQALADMLPETPAHETEPPLSAVEIARSPPVQQNTTTPTGVSSSAASQSPITSAAFPTNNPLPPAIARPPTSPSYPSDISSTWQQLVETNVRVERELKIQVEDNIDALAQRAGDYVVAQLDQREAELLERIAQQINQQPTRRAHLAGPGTTVGG